MPPAGVFHTEKTKEPLFFVSFWAKYLGGLGAAPPVVKWGLGAAPPAMPNALMRGLPRLKGAGAPPNTPRPPSPHQAT